MRLVIACGLAACATRSPPPPPTAPDPPKLLGTIGEQPFVARSALMLPVNFESTANSWDRTITLSHIYIYESSVSCPDDPDDKVEQPADRRTIHLVIEGRWPLPAPLLLEYSLQQDMETPRNRLLSAYFERGYDMQGAIGSIEIVGSSAQHGLLDIHLSSPGRGNPLFGAVSGKVPFVVCR